MIENRSLTVNLNTITSFDNLLSSSNTCIVFSINGAIDAPKNQRPLSSLQSVRLAKSPVLIEVAIFRNHLEEVVVLSALPLLGSSPQLYGLVW